MIVRILGDAQYEVDGAATERLGELDAELEAAMHSQDQIVFDRLLKAIENEVVSHGKRLDATEIKPSDLTLPHDGATIDEVSQLLSSEPIEKD